jgi:ribosome-associated protein
MPESDGLARAIFAAMGDKQARDLVLLDIRPVSLLTDFFVIATADSPRQMRAIVDAAADAARDAGGTRAIASEGTAESGWMLVDFGHVIAHIFDPERRAYYDLEAVWSRAPLVARMA